MSGNEAGHESEDIDGLRVATIGPADAELNVLVFMGMRACVDPVEMRRYDLLAREWKARVTVVDTPGCGYAGGKLSRPERAGLRHGDFTRVARRMVYAATQFDDRLRQRPVTLVGYSLGAGIAAAAAADPGLLRVGHLVAIEPASARRRNPLRLMAAARAEERWVAGHPAEGADQFVPDSVPHRAGDLALLGYALSRGCFARDMLRSNGVQAFPLQVVHADDSLVCPPDDISRVVSRCRRSGMNVYDVAVSGRHGMWQSLSDVQNLARETRKQWTY
ncbi:alpha/beta fold hydrolase [Mycobacterium sp. ITM-2016-00316]|uniref:alpha/beta fold hydrolase n=1 Tax=Mycobacterium sp. ITM-2016-00316 TaxID=2099695 RepID=UPI001304A92B|nr:alpha/beta fold hydrolase [Mycobacterium sp. ITM-2016-00316]WNG81137.1 alpha/beta fold hydrolase [Mycobacterium sp. ITM-2016-00316]